MAEPFKVTVTHSAEGVDGLWGIAVNSTCNQVSIRTAVLGGQPSATSRSNSCKSAAEAANRHAAG